MHRRVNWVIDRFINVYRMLVGYGLCCCPIEVMLIIQEVFVFLVSSS
jgi:hypothetical protein